MKALCFDRFGGPEVLEYREVPMPELLPGHARVRMAAIGLNFADIYRRRGNYHLAGNPPWILGYEGAGFIEALDTSSTEGKLAASFNVGQRVAFADAPFANAQFVVVPLEKLVPVPAEVPLVHAAALLLQGLTAHYLVHDSRKLAPGELALVHAAAGGVGGLLVQMVKLTGARAIGVVSSPEKQRVALEAGAEAALLYSEDWVAQALARSPGDRGVDVAYDSVGSTLLDSFRAVRVGGQVVFYGMAGGDPSPVDPRMLMDTSKTLTGGDLWNVLTSHRERLERSAELFTWLRDGRLKLSLARELPLSQGAQAHRLLESRSIMGKLVLVP